MVHEEKGGTQFFFFVASAWRQAVHTVDKNTWHGCKGWNKQSRWRRDLKLANEKKKRKLAGMLLREDRVDLTIPYRALFHSGGSNPPWKLVNGAMASRGPRLPWLFVTSVRLLLSLGCVLKSTCYGGLQNMRKTSFRGVVVDVIACFRLSPKNECPRDVSKKKSTTLNESSLRATKHLRTQKTALQTNCLSHSVQRGRGLTALQLHPLSVCAGKPKGFWGTPFSSTWSGGFSSQNTSLFVEKTVFFLCKPLLFCFFEHFF